MMKKSVLYKVQLHCLHHLKKHYKKFESYLDAMNHLKSQL